MGVGGGGQGTSEVKLGGNLLRDRAWNASLEVVLSEGEVRSVTHMTTLLVGEVE